MLQKVSLFFLAIVTIIPCYIKYRRMKEKFNQELLFKQRHNCVVMYNTNLGMSGWPPYKKRIRPVITEENCLDVLYEPIIYFINTSTKTLDIAYMMISIPKIYDALIEACKRGVNIRLLMNFEHSKRELNNIRKCIKEGIKVQLYISHQPDLGSIMHYKYMLKDYKGDSGYVLIGSMNLTRSAFLENYEDIVFTSDVYVATSLNENFDKCWKYIEAENQTLLNKTVLLDFNLFL